MKKIIKYEEAKSLLEVLEWKRKVSDEIEKIGFKAFREKNEAEFKGLHEEIEAARIAKARKAA